jgi:NCS1 family nucleobase:cation symporter-1
MEAADLSPIPEQNRTQSPFDLFLIFAAANVVATTMQTGAVLGSSVGAAWVWPLFISGGVVGAALVAVLAPIGSRFGAPTIIAARAPLGRYGAGLVAAVLYITNFAWIAVNNTIAASVCAEALGGSIGVWSAGLGIASTAIVARGPRAVGLADRIAVPLMLIAGGVLTWAAIARAPEAVAVQTAPGGVTTMLSSLDVIVGYQVSWLLMFADYSRYTRSPRASGTAVFFGLALPALWLMPLGWTLARVAGSNDPGLMMAATHTGWWTALLIALATVTTNFVNIYLSGLAWRSLMPSISSAVSIWTIGLIGTAIGLASTGLLNRFADLMVALGSVLVPVGGVFLAHFVILRRPLDIVGIYKTETLPAFGVPGLAAWAAGFAVYLLAASIGSTLPALATSVVVYLALSRRGL